ncbi:MAG: hypothetical protein ACR2JB_27700 [Bryobacteraceae bacterium]
MAQTRTIGSEDAFADRTRGEAESKAWSPAYQAYQILHVGFVVAPIVAGLDKFSHLLVNWDMYLAPVIARLSPIGGHGLMLLIGVIEIVAGILVAIKPRIGAYVVSAWLLGIVINLLIIPGYFDIALRDFGLSLGALALGRLSKDYSS